MTDNSSDPSGSSSHQQARRRGVVWLERVARRARRLLEDNTMALGLSIGLNLVVILATAAVWYQCGGDIALVGGVAAALLAMTGAMLPLIRGRGSESDEKPLWPPLILMVVPVAVVCVAVPFWIVWLYLNNRAVDLTHEFHIKPTDSFKQGDTVIASAHTDRPKQRLTITFAVSEHDPTAPVCAPSSKLIVELRSGENPEGPQSGKADEQFTFELGNGRKDIELAIRMEAEPNCVLDLSVASARLDD